MKKTKKLLIKVPRWARSNERIKLVVARQPEGVLTQQLLEADTGAKRKRCIDLARQTCLNIKKKVKLPYGLTREGLNRRGQ